MEFIDGTVVNIALPVMQTAFHASAAQTEWVVAIYGLLLSACLLLAGALGDRFGQRRMFGLGVLSFALSSCWCAFAPSIMQMLIGRALQGMGGACLVANSLAFLSSSTPPEFRGNAIGTWSALASLMTASGPILGGWLVQHGSWRFVFLVNIPIAALALWITAFKTQELSSVGRVKTLDLTGTCFGALSLGSLTLGLIEWDSSPHLGLTSCALGALTAIAFLRWEAKSRNPLLPLTLFRNHLFVGANLVTFLLYGSLSLLVFYLPIKLIQIQRYSPQRAGAAMLTLVLSLSLLSRWAGSLARQIGARIMISGGSLTVAAGFIVLAVSDRNTNYWTSLAPGLFLTGAGLALIVSPLTTAVMSSVEDERSGIASGVNNTVAQIAALLFLATSTPIFQHLFDVSLRTQLAVNQIGTHDSAAIWAQRHLLGAITAPSLRAEAAVDCAYAHSFSVVIVVAGAAGAIFLRGDPVIRK